MEPIIKRVVVKRFRSFQNEAVNFDNPMFLLGRNGAGKSNFADVFSFISDAMSLPLQAVFDKRGGISAVRNRAAARSAPPNLGVSVQLGALNGQSARGIFAFEIRALPNYGFEIVREQGVVHFDEGIVSWYDRRGSDFRSNADGLSPALEPVALSLPVVGGDRRFAPLLKALSSMRVYSIEPKQLREMQDPDSGIALKPDGSNAASVLQEMERNDPESLRRVKELLAAIVPHTESVSSKKHGNKLSLEFVQEWTQSNRVKFEAFNMSDGTLRAVGLLLAVFQAPRPTLLVIEEPEATIHPGALGAILDVIRHASQHMQVLVTTHSPELIDAARWVKPEHLRIAVWQNGASHILPISDIAAAVMRDHLMGPGELLRSNALTPAPLFSEAPGQLFFEGLG
jgi:predicted ATPase